MALDHQARSRAALSGIYAIVNDTNADPAALTRATLDAGVRIIQYRAKHRFNDGHVRAMRTITREYGALLILNDCWQRVAEFDADGAHVGPDDAAWDDLPRIRERLSERIFGVSCGTEEEARFAHRAGADYMGVGCVFATTSKSDAGAPIGIAGLRRVAAAAPLPVAAIGGITLETLPDVRGTGVAMAAVISAIAAAGDPGAAAAALVRVWNGD